MAADELAPLGPASQLHCKLFADIQHLLIAKPKVLSEVGVQNDLRPLSTEMIKYPFLDQILLCHLLTSRYLRTSAADCGLQSIRRQIEKLRGNALKLFRSSVLRRQVHH